jgi:hypothetical protein
VLQGWTASAILEGARGGGGLTVARRGGGGATSTTDDGRGRRSELRGRTWRQ